MVARFASVKIDIITNSVAIKDWRNMKKTETGNGCGKRLLGTRERALIRK